MKKLLMTGAAIMALSTAAGASTFSLVGGTPGSIPGGIATNEILGNVWGVPGIAGVYGAQVQLDADADIQVDFIGYEAGWINAFTFGGTSTNTEGGPNGLEQGNNGTNNSEWAVFTNPGPTLQPISSYTVFGVTAGELNFSFSVNNGADSVANGSNPDNVGMTPNFFVSYGQGDRSTIYLWLDDGGAGNDDNHDDFVVRLTTNSNPPGPTPVPLPAAGLMLMGALGGLGLMKRRK